MENLDEILKSIEDNYKVVANNNFKLADGERFYDIKIIEKRNYASNQLKLFTKDIMEEMKYENRN